MENRISRVAVPLVVWLAAWPALAQSAPPAPVSGPAGSPVVDQIVADEPPPLVVRKQASRPVPQRRHRFARHDRVPRDLERPALAGVTLVAPLPPPGEPPHIEVPLPAYALDSLVTAYTTPPPPIVCHPTRRDPDAPDPRLYRETPVLCAADNP